MPKTVRPEKSAKKQRGLYSIHPWEAHHKEKHSEITAYVENSGKWETVLTVHNTSGAAPETLASFILALVHEHQNKQNTLHDAMNALELVLNDCLNFTSEQAIERVVRNIKKVI